MAGREEISKLLKARATSGNPGRRVEAVLAAQRVRATAMLKCGMSGGQVKGEAAFLPLLQRKRGNLRVSGVLRHHLILNPLLLRMRAEDTKSGR